jgi:hypothetical protein
MAVMVSHLGTSGSVDEEGYRSYKVEYQVRALYTESVDSVLYAEGLPLPGQVWEVDGDINPWIWCRPQREATPYRKDEPNMLWRVACTFSNKPQGKRCHEQKIENPLLEPPKVTGGGTTEHEEALYDRFGQPIVNSCWEQLRGQKVEFDVARSSVKIQMNVGSFDVISLALAMQNRVNAYPLWGLPRRCVKLRPVEWEPMYWGTCNKYYQLKLEFDIRLDTFDRDILDEGTKALHGHWDAGSGDWIVDNLGGTPPDPSDPRCFDRVEDKKGNPMKMVLDGAGKPYKPDRPYITGAGGCSLCPRTYQYWQVDGFDTDPDFNLLLAHTTGCTWFGSDGAKTVTLTYNNSIQRWQLTASAYNGDWRMTNNDWECLGENTLVNQAQGTVADRGPGEVTVTPSGGTQPGKIHIEKYSEADFLLLGIPTDF